MLHADATELIDDIQHEADESEPEEDLDSQTDIFPVIRSVSAKGQAAEHAMRVIDSPRDPAKMTGIRGEFAVPPDRSRGSRTLREAFSSSREVDVETLSPRAIPCAEFSGRNAVGWLGTVCGIR
ncbi:MAG: hypothetical protein NVSMB9_27680 [Isosphaeraceae bacterium]